MYSIIALLKYNIFSGLGTNEMWIRKGQLQSKVLPDLENELNRTLKKYNKFILEFNEKQDLRTGQKKNEGPEASAKAEYETQILSVAEPGQSETQILSEPANAKCSEPVEAEKPKNSSSNPFGPESDFE